MTKPRIPKLGIVDFCRDERLLNFRPWPAQEMALRALFGEEMPPELLPLWHQMAETEDLYVPRRYRSAVWIWGRQSGKNECSGAAAGYVGSVEDPARHLRRGRYAQCTVVATRQEQARDEFIARLYDDLSASEALSRELVEYDGRAGGDSRKCNKDQIVFRNRSLIKAYPCTARSVRGPSCYMWVGDEIAHWARVAGSIRADTQVIRAVRPSLRIFRNLGLARDLWITTPQAKEGEAYGAYEAREARREWQLTLHAPTWIIDPGWNWDEMRIEQEIDPEGFAIEYGAAFAEMIEGVFTREEVDAALVRRAPLPPDSSRLYWGRIDPAFIRDRFGLGVGHREGTRTRVDWALALSPPKGGAVSMREALDRVEAEHNRYRPRHWTVDQYAGEPIAQELKSRGIPVRVVPWTAGYKKTIYSTFTAQVRAGDFEAPWSEVAEREMIRLQRRVMKSGIVSIGHPAGSGESDDLADVFAGLAHDCASRPDRPPAMPRVIPLP